MVVVLKKNKQTTNKIPLRKPSEVMKLERLGSFHQSRLSFSRQLINEIINNKWTFNISEWNISDDGIGHAVISANSNTDVFSLVIFCHSIRDDERSDRVIADKWDMTFSLFKGVPNKKEIAHMSQNLKVQELGRHLSKQLTLSRANKSLRIFEKVIEALSSGKQPSHNLINDIGYLVRTTAVYGNGKFGIGDFSEIQNQNFLKKPFQAEMLTVYLIRYFSIELVNFLSKIKGGSKAVRLSETISKHLGVGNATGLGMAPFLINHQELLNKWIDAKETALSRVFSLNKISASKQSNISNLIEQAFKYTLQWKVNDPLQANRIKTLNTELKFIINDVSTKKILNQPYPLKTLFDFFNNKISIETQEMLHSIFLEPFSEIIDDLTNNMSTIEKSTVPVNFTVDEIIKIIEKNYKWALDIDIKKDKENYFFWYTSQAKLEPRLGIRKKDIGSEKELPFDIPHQIQKALIILKILPKSTSASEAMIVYPKIRNIIRRVIINNFSPYSEIQDNLIGSKTKPIDILRCKLSFFGASKYDPKSNLWTRITLFQGAPLPHQLKKQDESDLLFPSLSPTN